MGKPEPIILARIFPYDPTWLGVKDVTDRVTVISLIDEQSKYPIGPACTIGLAWPAGIRGDPLLFVANKHTKLERVPVGSIIHFYPNKDIEISERASGILFVLVTDILSEEPVRVEEVTDAVRVLL
jgi:hypothetical protein